jgi:hypothetical protein
LALVASCSMEGLLIWFFVVSLWAQMPGNTTRR